jgi:hypothetical protein
MSPQRLTFSEREMLKGHFQYFHLPNRDRHLAHAGGVLYGMELGSVT